MMQESALRAVLKVAPSRGIASLFTVLAACNIAIATTCGLISVRALFVPAFSLPSAAADICRINVRACAWCGCAGVQWEPLRGRVSSGSHSAVVPGAKANADRIATWCAGLGLVLRVRVRRDVVAEHTQAAADRGRGKPVSVLLLCCVHDRPDCRFVWIAAAACELGLAVSPSP